MAIVGMAFGAAMSSSPWERFWNGDEDVATPFHAGPSHDVPRLQTPSSRGIDNGGTGRRVSP